MARSKTINIRKLKKECNLIRKQSPTWPTDIRDYCSYTAMSAPKKKLSSIAALIPSESVTPLVLHDITNAVVDKMVKDDGNDVMVKIRAIEELGELTQALTKSLRGRDNYENILEEIADVKNVIAEVERLYKIDPLDPEYIIRKIQYTKMYREAVRSKIIEGNSDDAEENS